jgi:hypothetical protein
MMILRVPRAGRCLLVPLALLLATASVHAECDTTGPQLTAFAFNPTNVNVMAGPGAVTCTMTFSDTPAGVEEAGCSFRAPGFLQTRGCAATTPIAGDRQNGTFSCSVDIPRYSEAGTWKASINATDSVGNVTVMADFDLLLGGFPTDLSVSSTSDVVGPALTAFDFSPQNIDVSSGQVDLTCSMTLTDALSGTAFANCFFEATVTEHSQVCTATVPSSGTRNDGTFSCTISVPRYAVAGTWVAAMLAYDQAGNLSAFDATAIQGLGDPTDLGVTSSPQDLAAPFLADFDFNPKTADTTSGSVIVTCTMDLTDSLAGVKLASCQFTSPTAFQTQDCLAQVPSSGTPTNGTYTCDVVMPQYSEGGVWTATVELYDVAGNLVELDSLALAGAGLPTDLEVDCGGGTAGSVLLFTSSTTAVWDAISGAFFYNIYRGNINGLVDTDSDGQPDGGYGTCWTANDANPTDTTFIDSEVPTVAGDGFHYLVNYRTIAGDEGLGTNSAGVPRVVAVPCP